MTAVIRAEDVTVRYGKRVAVDHVTLSVEPGAVYALLGRNGAGKSSFVRTLLGQLRPGEGRVEVLGEDVWRRRALLMERIGIVPEEADAPREMRVRDLAVFSSRLYSRWSQPAFDARIRRFDVDPATRAGELSKGQKKQVALALALAVSPELLILDDPTLGLDVVARTSLFEEVIADMADRGITVFITTHELASIEPIADRVGILSGGRLVLDEALETLGRRFRRLRFAGRPAALPAAPFVSSSVRAWGNGTEAVIANFDESAFERFRADAKLPHAEVSPMSLEDIFVAVTGEPRGAGS